MGEPAGGIKLIMFDLELVRSYSPRAVILQIGSNDPCDLNETPEVVVYVQICTQVMLLFIWFFFNHHLSNHLIYYNFCVTQLNNYFI